MLQLHVRRLHPLERRCVSTVPDLAVNERTLRSRARAKPTDSDSTTS